jgi:hypothetical protein
MRTAAGRQGRRAYGLTNWPDAVTRLFAPLVSLLAVVACLAAVAPAGAWACEKHLEGHYTGNDTGAEASGR